MGTKLQYKSYVPTYNVTGDFYEDASRCWSQYYDDRTQSGHSYNDFMPMLVNGYSECDKEMLKRTMLEHEAIFRKQVYELHRLYRIQKNLMDELIKKKLNRFSLPVDMIYDNSFLSNMAIDGSKTMWQMSCFPVVSTRYSRAPVAESGNVRSPINFFKGSSLPSSMFLDQNVGTSKSCRNLDPGPKCSPRKMFDLRLPADQYTESEILEISERDYVAMSLSRASTSVDIPSINPENDVKLTLGTSEDPKSRENGRKAESHTENGMSTLSLVDLNLPVNDITGSASTQTFQPRAHCEGIQAHLLPVNLQTSFIALPRDVFNDRHKHEGTKSDILVEDMEEIRRRLPHLKKPAQIRTGVNSCSPLFCHEKFPAPSGAVELKHDMTHEILLCDHNKRQTWQRQKSDYDNETFGRSAHVADPENLDIKLPLMPGSFAVDSLFASQQVSSWTKSRNSISHVPVAVQALPCFDICERLHTDGDTKSTSRFCSDSSLFPNVFGHDSLFDPNSASHKHHPSTTFGKQNLNGKCYEGSQCTDVKSAEDLDLNEMFPNGIQGGLTVQQELPMEISWIKNKQESNNSFELIRLAPGVESGLSRGYCQLLSGFGEVPSETAQKQETQNVPFLTNMQDMSSTLLIKGSKMMKNETSDRPRCTRIIGFPLHNEVQNNTLLSPSVSDPEQSFADKKTSFTGHINLNSAMPCTEYPNKSKISPEGKADVPSAPSSLNVGVGVKIAFQIDLEEPFLSKGRENILSQEESIGARCLLPHTENPSSKTGSSCIAERSDEALMTEAAKSIVTISLDIPTHVGETVCGLSSTDVCDSLHWFTEVTLNAECARDSARDTMAGGHGGSEVSEDDGLDIFEYMTLKLKETNVNEYLCSLLEQDNHKRVGKRTTPLLLLKPRRGQGRKRRQRRDFQKHILPGLASLSRNEVTEDLQTIRGLVRATGTSWQTSVTRRNIGRNRLQSKPKGGCRRRNLPLTATEAHVSQPVAQPIDIEFKVDESSMIGWGKTRRCRRQRCPPSNVALPKLKG